MSTMPPISSLGSAPLNTFNSPAASTPLIQSRKSLLAISWFSLAKVIVRAAVTTFIRERPALPGSQRAIHRLRCKRHLHQTHIDGIVDGVGDRRRRTERRHLADALGAERPVRLVMVDIDVLHYVWHIVETRDLVVGE